MKKLGKKLIYFLALLPLIAFSVMSAAQQSQNPDNELNNESVNYHSDETKKALPQTIVFKKDQSGKISVFTSAEPINVIKAKTGDQLEKLPFKNLDSVAGLRSENLSASINELDNDTPRQSWYFYWGFGYGYGYNFYPYSYYYYPVYYYNYSYFPYYYNGYNGCSYYYYRPYY